jgi:hypothetical protein
LSVGDVLFAISEAGLTLKANKTEDILKVYPAERLTPALAAAIKEHKIEIIRILREDQEFRRTGIIQSERQVFEVAREFFGLNGRGGAATSARPVVRRIPKPSGHLETPPKQVKDDR